MVGLAGEMKMESISDYNEVRVEAELVKEEVVANRITNYNSQTNGQ